MKLSTISLLIFSLLFIIVIILEPAMAGPGGKIAKAVIDSFWGKVVLFLLTIFFLPLILLMFFREKRAERRALHDLQFMALQTPIFNWLSLRERFSNCFIRVHDAWSKEDMAEASEYMTDWYWQNQQLIFLDRWQREGLVNHCDIKTIKEIKPLLFSHMNDSKAHEGSKLVVAITAEMADYLAEQDSGKIVEGDNKYKEVERLWTFTLNDGIWRLSNIEDSVMMMDYAKLSIKQPKIEATLSGSTVSSSNV